MANEKLNSQVVARRSFLKKWYKTNCPLNGMAGAGNCIGAGFEPAKPLRAYLLFREAVSATHPPSQMHGGLS